MNFTCFKTDPSKTFRNCSSLCHRPASADTSGERDEIDGRIADRVNTQFRRHVDDLNDAFRNTGFPEGASEAFCREGCLWRWLEEDGISGDDRWKDCVYGCEIRIARKR